MNKRLVLYLLSYFLCLLGYSQKEDYTWLLGSGTLNQINFTETDYSLSTLNPDSSLRIHITNASISDSSGNLLLFTGGAAIYDNLGNIIENGDSINYGYIWELFDGIPAGAYTSRNGAIFLKSLNDNGHLLFHLREDTNSYVFPNLDYGVGVELLYSKITKNTNNYYIEGKNNSLIEDTMNTSGIAACRHGNGRDWWIMASEGGSNCYYTLLYSPDTIMQVHKQCLGVKSFYADGGQSLFSPDGSLFVRGSIKDGVEIFDFDRCSGLLSNPRQIPLSEFGINFTNEYSGSVSIAPNNRFLYVATGGRLFQYDLNIEDIILSKQLIHNRDTATTLDRLFLSMQLAPTGEIIVGGGSWINEIHIIHNPNEYGVSCDFEVKIPIPRDGSDGLPNFPNYRLGALTGSACDTLGVGIKELSTPIEILLQPNPASTYVEIDYGFLPWQSKSEAVLQIHNLLGEKVFSMSLPQYSGKQIIDISKFAAGVYFVGVYDGGRRVGMERMLVD
ncbi:MAG: T9SS type A sorting domain-containing protein [Chitinophagales bacterium]|nr:T9SS type A sorting domain-containing protein [Chitinophagales bacterium]